MTATLQLPYDLPPRRSYPPPMINGWQQNGSFVLKFKPDTDVNAGRIRGHIEHLASGKVIGFNSFEGLQLSLCRILKDMRTEFQQADTIVDDITREF